MSQMTWPAPKAVVVVGQRDRPSGDDRLARLVDDELAEVWSLLGEAVDLGPDLSGWLHWEVPLGTGGAHPMAKPTPKLLFDFADLADGQAKDFLRFARRHGALDLCRHGKPATHVPAEVLHDLAEPYNDRLEREWMRYGFSDGDLLPVPARFPEALVGCRRLQFADESLSIWRAYALEANTIIDILGDLAHGKPVPLQRWRPLAAQLDEPIEAILSEVPLLRLSHLSEAKQWAAKVEFSEQRVPLLNEQRPLIASCVDRWLHLGGVRPRYTWGRRGPTLDLVGPGGLFSALAFQLADLLTDSRLAVVRCCECKQRYRPNRRLRADQDNFCTREPCRVAARKRRFCRREADSG